MSAITPPIMYKVIQVSAKQSGEIVYIGITPTIQTIGPILAYKNYDVLAYKFDIGTNAMLQSKALEQVGVELKQYFDEHGAYPRDNQVKFNANYGQIINNILQSFTGPIEIDALTIDAEVDAGHLHGNYIYYHQNNQNVEVDYVGRCTDDELQDRIKHRLDPDDNNYKDFQERKTSHAYFRYAQSKQEAIDIECLLYHYYGGKIKLINNVHPARKGEHCLICDEVQNLI